MTTKQKVELAIIIDSSRIDQVVKFAQEQGYDLDTVQGLLVTAVIDEILDAKLGLNNLRQKGELNENNR